MVSRQGIHRVLKNRDENGKTARLVAVRNKRREVSFGVGGGAPAAQVEEVRVLAAQQPPLRQRRHASVVAADIVDGGLG